MQKTAPHGATPFNRARHAGLSPFVAENIAFVTLGLQADQEIISGCYPRVPDTTET
jgi:hypothetical protein